MEKKYLIIDKIVEILDEQSQKKFSDYLIKAGQDIYLSNAVDIAEKIWLNIYRNKRDEIEKNVANLKAEIQEIFYFDTTEIKKLIVELENNF